MESLFKALEAVNGSMKVSDFIKWHVELKAPVTKIEQLNIKTIVSFQEFHTSVDDSFQFYP